MENDYIEELSNTLSTKDKFYVGMDAEAFARIFTEEKLKKLSFISIQTLNSIKPYLC
ncbi:hypothetical protein AB1J10_00220 [Staphylococcus cohnii species complex 1663]